MGKVNVQIRSRKVKEGDSLYLDIYVEGKREYETLGLVITPELTKADKTANKAKWQEAELIKAKRMLEIRNGIFGFKSEAARNILFYDYMRDVASLRETLATRKGWLYTVKRLEGYCANSPVLDKVDVKWIEGFVSYMKQKRYKLGTQAVTISYIKACLNHAVKSELITTNPAHKLSPIQKPESERAFLTIQELRTLAKTPPSNKEVARSFLFCCLTGLRWSDVSKLTWGMIQEGRLGFRQQKTRRMNYLDLGEEALQVLGERGGHDEPIFFKQKLAAQMCNYYLKRWVARAGINKDISFHCSRHTFAMLQLEYGTDLYTVSTLLGHTNIKTTQIYAKVQDKAKKEALNRLPKIF